MKSKFLTVYDYGSGGIWRFVMAVSKNQIMDRYPNLEVVDEIPSWMDGKILSKLESLIIDIDDSDNQYFTNSNN